MILFDVCYRHGTPVATADGDLPGTSVLRWMGIEPSTSGQSDSRAPTSRAVGVRSFNAGDLDAAAEALGIDPVHLRQRIDRRRPALTLSADGHRLTLRTLHYEDELDAVETGQLDIHLRPGRVVSLHLPPAGETQPLPTPADLRDMADEFEVAAALCREVVRGYARVCDELMTDMEEVEESVFSAERTADAQRIYRLKREVAEVRRAATPLAPTLVRVSESEHVNRRHAKVFADLIERLHHVIESVDTLDAMLTSVFDAYVAQMSLQQNDDMRRISAGAALIVVPTLIAGIYGMNFRHMPELGWTYGYPMVLGLMAATVLGMWIAFRRSGWF